MPPDDIFGPYRNRRSKQKKLVKVKADYQGNPVALAKILGEWLKQSILFKTLTRRGQVFDYLQALQEEDFVCIKRAMPSEDIGPLREEIQGLLGQEWEVNLPTDGVLEEAALTFRSEKVADIGYDRDNKLVAPLLRAWVNGWVHDTFPGWSWIRIYACRETSELRSNPGLFKASRFHLDRTEFEQNVRFIFPLECTFPLEYKKRKKPGETGPRAAPTCLNLNVGDVLLFDTNFFEHRSVKRVVHADNKSAICLHLSLANKQREL